MISPSTNTSRFGGPFSAALGIGQAAGADWSQIYQPDQKNIAANYLFPPPSLGLNLNVADSANADPAIVAAVPEADSRLILLTGFPAWLFGRRQRPSFATVGQLRTRNYEQNNPTFK